MFEISSTRQIVQKILTQDLLPTNVFIYGVCIDPVSSSLQLVREIFLSRNLI